MDLESKTTTLRDYLIDKSISVEDCTKETGIPEATIYRIWNGNNKPSYKYKKILTNYTNGLVTW